MTFAEKFPESTFYLDGVEVHTTGHESLPVMWMSDWSRCWDLADAGLLRREDGGPGTYGHVTFYVVRSTAQLAIAPDASIVAEPVQAPEEQHETVRLFEPAPTQLAGQLTF